MTIARYASGLVDIGYQGYFEGKNYLGECATLAFLLSLHEILHRGWRRALGVIVAVMAILLVFLSQFKNGVWAGVDLSILALRLRWS